MRYAVIGRPVDDLLNAIADVSYPALFQRSVLLAGAGPDHPFIPVAHFPDEKAAHWRQGPPVGVFRPGGSEKKGHGGKRGRPKLFPAGNQPRGASSTERIRRHTAHFATDLGPHLDHL